MLCLKNGFKSRENKVVLITTLVILTVFVIVQFYAIHNLTITGADQLIYATQGKIFARDAIIQYRNYYFDNSTKFLYLALHGFSYTLFSTVNYLYNYVFGFTGDLYFLNISNYYLILITLLMFSQLLYYLPRNSKHYAFFGVALFLTSPVVVLLGYSRSIDTYRIFLLLSSIIFFYRYMSNKNTPNLILLGAALGLSSNSHMIGLVFVGLLITSTLLFEEGCKTKLKRIILLSLVTMLFGAYHYPLQLLCGDGWIFRKNYSGVPSNILNIASATMDIVKEPLQSKASLSSSDKPEAITINITGSLELIEDAVIMPEDTGAREVDSTEDLVKNGFLGIFFRFHYFGIFNWLLPILMIIYYRTSRPSRKELVIGINLAIATFIISLEGFANYRYQFTLLPFFSILITIYLFKLFDLKSTKRRTINIVVFFMLGLSTLNVLYTTRKSIATYISKYTTKARTTQSTKVNIQKAGDVIKSKATSNVVTFVNNLEINKGQNMLATGTRLFNYYSDVPTYFMNNANYAYTENGKVYLCPNNDIPTAANTLRSEYGIKYIAIRTTDKIKPGCIDEIISLYATKIFDSGSYRVYEL